MPVQACLMTAIHPSGLLACQAGLIEFSSGVRQPDRQVFPAIHYEACLIVYGRPEAFAHESSKVGGRGIREEERQERQRPGG